MMNLDLEEQEQLDALKAWWAKWGNLITGVLILMLAAFAGWNGWQWYERKRAVEASAIFEELDKAVRNKDVARVERAFTDIKDRYKSTAYAQMAGLAAAKTLHEGDKKEQAEAALKWTVENARDEEYKSMARVRLAGVLIEREAYADAMALLQAPASAAFAPLYADKRGDALLAQGKREEARAEYKKAFEGLDKSIAYRETVELKLNSVGGSGS
jgi:predicted negative regulator of RcsB-dependent stress response